jgi:hypothetical protein
LRVTDFASRYLPTCEALSTTQERFAFTVFEQTFREFGLPRAIRTDNGVPFTSAHALYGLGKLSVWWLRWGAFPADSDSSPREGEDPGDRRVVQNASVGQGFDGRRGQDLEVIALPSATFRPIDGPAAAATPALTLCS